MTATSAAGFALMVESLGAALAMEVPITVVLVQRMGPSSGAATTSAQGDVLAPLCVSGGYQIPTLCPAQLEDCARLSATALNLAETLRSPVILLTEREIVSALRTLDVEGDTAALLDLPPPVRREAYSGDPDDFRPYGNLNALQVPRILEPGNDVARTRFQASMHGEQGLIVKATPEAVRNTTRLQSKIDDNLELFPQPRLDLQEGAETLVISYGCTDYAAREAVGALRAREQQVSHLTLLTLFPVQAELIRKAAQGVKKVVVAEENLFGLYRKVLCGERLFDGQAVVGANGFGTLVSPEQIIAEVSP